MVKFKKAPKRKLRFGKTRHSAKYNIFLAPMRKHLICAMATYAITQEIFLGLKKLYLRFDTNGHIAINIFIILNYPI